MKDLYALLTRSTESKIHQEDSPPSNDTAAFDQYAIFS